MRHRPGQGLGSRIAVALVALCASGSGALADQTYAPWLTQIGISSAALSAANWGRSQLLGVVDSGVVAANAAFAPGQVSLVLSSCAAITFRCPNGALDDNGHGTAVAAIAAGYGLAPFASNFGGYALPANSVISVAPDANIVAEKVLNSKGFGFTADIASGIVKAADAGASVINVSISYGNSADIVSAINYAAAKGAFVVWAGGNDGKALLLGANTTSLSAGAVTHLLFAGSVNPQNVISSFSSTPGQGRLITTAGASTAYASRWIMAPGESILAPDVSRRGSGWAYWSGTSMSAPMVSGSLILLEGAWPVLRTNGTAANLLLLTTTDLGAKGVDGIYGAGLVNLDTAFKPYGTLTVALANGSVVPVSGLTGSLISGGALGGLADVKAKLANYVALDSFLRNFSVNLSGLILLPSVPYSLNRLPTNVQSGPMVMKLSGGGEFTYWQGSDADDAADRVRRFGLKPETTRDLRTGYAALKTQAGTMFALGYGVPVQYAYVGALHGSDDIARLSGELVGTHLSALAQGGQLFAFGTALGERTRVAFSWSGSARLLDPGAAPFGGAWTIPQASATGIGLAHRIDDAFSAGVTFGSVVEKHGLLGSLYDPASPVGLGASNNSRSIGLSAAINVDRTASFLFEADFATTASSTGSGLLVGTTAIRSRSYGATFMKQSLLDEGDRLMISVKQPLRVVAGQAGVIVPSIDELGLAHYRTEWASLVPSGREVDYKLSYDRMLDRSQAVSVQTAYRKDVLNVSGRDDRSVSAVWTLRF